MSADQPLLLIFGGGDQADQITHSGQRITIAGSSDLGKLLPNRELIHRALITRDHQPHPSELSGYPVVVNMITEAENSARILGKLEGLLGGFAGRVINPPDAVLASTRDQIAELLSGIPGLIVPKVVRLRGGDATAAANAIESAGIVPPIIVREIGTHTGRTVRLCTSIAQVTDDLQSGKEYIATQFVDFVSGDGLYRKYRVWFIGARRILRHLLIAGDWSVHGHARFDFMVPRPELIAEERAMFESEDPFPAEVETVFNAIRSRMPLDFFGLDFAIAPDSRVVLFEANATMSFFARLFDPRFEYLSACVPPARAAFMELVGLSKA